MAENSDNNQNISHCSSVFVPFESLTQRVISSIVSVATTFRKPNFDYSQRTVLIFLLEIKKKLEEMEDKIRENNIEIDQQSIQHVQAVRQWLVNINKQPLNWTELENKYSKIAKQNCDEMAHHYGSDSAEPYFELNIKTVSC